MWGGGERHTLALASILRGRGHQVCVIQCGHDQFAPYLVGEHRLALEDRDPGIVTWLRVLRRAAPDVICEVRGGHSRFGCSLDVAAWTLGIRLMPIEHSPYPPPPAVGDYGRRRRIPMHTGRLILHSARRLIHKLSVTHTIAVAEHVGTSASRYFGLMSEDLSVVHNGIDPARFGFSSEARSRIRAELGLDDCCFVVGAIGRLSDEKRLGLLLRAFSLFRRRCRADAALVIAGDGPAKSELCGLRDILGLQSSVQLLGFRDDVHEVLSAMDVVASASASEGLSLGLLEALAAERLCVCLPYAGLDEVASSNPAVEVVRSRELADLVDALVVVSELSPEERTAIGARGRVDVQRRFTEKTQLLRIATRLEECGNRPR
ncbi:MAG: glycosyltransferase family 4 protein [Vicinamibacterales bacterium]